MPRPRRTDYEGAWHHVMNRGISHADIFTDDRDRRVFLEELSSACEFAVLELHAYCLMRNHYHLLLRSREGRLSVGMQRLASNFTHAMNQRHDRDGPIFRGRFASRDIVDNTHLVQVLRYIHLDPVDAQLVGRAADWPWSSAATYSVGNGVRPMGLPPRNLETAELLGLFGVQPHRAFADFMAAGIDDATRRAYDAKLWQ